MLTLLVLVSSAWAEDVLPVRRVRFYESGVAWFERAGTVVAGAALPVPRSHLDDALKTLVVLGGDVELGAVTFASSRPEAASRAMAGWTENPGYSEVLLALRGAVVLVRTTDGRALQGALVQVEGPLPVVGGEGAPRAVLEQHALTLLTDGGLVRMLTSEMTSVRPVDPAITSRIREAAGALSDAAAREGSQLDVHIGRGGALALGYLAEAPVYRVSYRLADPGKGAAALQGWALIHNDTDEGWKGVQVELVNGRPDSFLAPLAAPRYAERALVTPEVHLPSVPQLATQTADGMWDESLSAHGVGMGVYGVGGGSGGSGYGTGTVGALERTALQQAEAVNTPTQFVYRVAQPLDLPPRHSALLPLVDSQVSAELAVLAVHGGARLGLWTTNTTGRTLPEGLVAVLEGGGLGGEAVFERLKPGEDQLVEYGTELDVDPRVAWATAEADVRQVGWAGSALALDVVTPRQLTLTVNNRSGRPRPLWVPLTLHLDDVVQGNVRIEHDRFRGHAWAVLEVAPGASTTSFSVERTATEARDPRVVAASTLRAWAEADLGDAGILLEAAALRDLLEALPGKAAEVRASLGRAEASLESLRRDLAASAEGVPSLARRLGAAEGDASRLRERLAALEAERGDLELRLVQTLQGLAGARTVSQVAR